MVQTPPKLLDQLRDKIRLKHYSIRTEEAYADWVRRFILHHGKRHPRELGGAEVEAFLTHLAVVGKVAASTQNQAKSALLFLYREVLGIELPWLDGVEWHPRACRRRACPCGTSPRCARPPPPSARTLCGPSLTPLWRPPSAQACEEMPATA
jgi:hypothetical protein